MLISKKIYICIKWFFKDAYTPPFNRHKAPLDCFEGTDLRILRDLRLQHRKNLFICYLNINSLRNNISDLWVLLYDLQLVYFVVSETKLDGTLPTAQFAIENYEIRAWRGRGGHRGGLIEFVKRGMICKRVKGLKLSFWNQSVQKLPFPERNGFVWASIGHPNLII